MKLLDDLKALDECLVSVAMREDGFLEVVGVHHPYAINKKLRELGYHRIATKPCGCADEVRATKARKMKSKGAQEQRFLHLKNHKRGEPRVPSHPGPKKGYYE